MPFVEHYEIRKDLLRSELEVFKEQHHNSKQECKSILDVLQFVYPHRVCYSQLYTTFLIAVVIPVTTAENERSFSCMKRVKTYSRSVMDDDRLEDLETLSINRERSSRINMEDIEDDFAKLGNRRIALIYVLRIYNFIQIQINQLLLQMSLMISSHWRVICTQKMLVPHWK